MITSEFRSQPAGFSARQAEFLARFMQGWESGQNQDRLRDWPGQRAQKVADLAKMPDMF